MVGSKLEAVEADASTAGSPDSNAAEMFRRFARDTAVLFARSVPSHRKAARGDGSRSSLPVMLVSNPRLTFYQSAVPEVIERMDEYYLSKEDWDALVELGLDQNKDELVLKKISAATKAAFTRKYVQEFRSPLCTF